MLVKKITKEPILSICIPTYNRPQTFRRMLENLLPQLNSSMEIIIRDDSTNLKTKNIFKELIKGHSVKFSYYKGKKIGLDAANLFLLEKSNGEFLWWLSDDDILIEGGIKKVISLIKNHKNLNFIWANFGYENLNTLAINRSDGFFCDRNDVLNTLGTSIGLLSTYILRRSVAIKGISYGKRHVHGFSFASTSIVFWVLTQPGKSYFLRGPYVLCIPTTINEIKALNKDVIVNNGFWVYGVYFHDALYELRKSFDKKAVRKMLDQNFSSLWRGMIVAWVGGWENPKGKRFKMIQYYWSFYECWIAITLMCLPKLLVKKLYHLYKIFYKNRNFNFSKKRL